ncbi:Short-chain dehydrogenase [Balamuthia mandrillaris]
MEQQQPRPSLPPPPVTPLESIFSPQRQNERKVFIVTGSTQGLGKDIALNLAKTGVASRGLVLCGRNKEKGEKAAQEIQRCVQDKAEQREEERLRVVFVQADLTKEEDCRKVVQTCDRLFGTLHGLVNSAGLSTRGTLEETDCKLWDTLFALNVRAPFILCQEAARIMKREHVGGAIVNISSINAKGGQIGMAAYAPTKGALDTFTRNIAQELQPFRIRANAIQVGWLLTENEDKLQRELTGDEKWLEKAEKEHPMGRLLRPQDISNLACFLLSDAANMLTGSVIPFHPDQVQCSL